MIELPIMFMTGAGLSAPSGISTFRSGPDALWNSKYLQELGTIDQAIQRPIEYWRVWGPMRETCRNATPNAAHVALAEFTQRTEEEDYLLVTQNVDGLLQKAGAETVREIHGSMFWLRCRKRGCQQDDWFDDGNWRRHPNCPLCGSAALPAMTFFGEYVEPIPLELSLLMVRHCRTYMVIGSSGIVPPAARLAYYARDNGSRMILVNDHNWDDDGLFHDFYEGSCDEILPELLS